MKTLSKFTLHFALFLCFSIHALQAQFFNVDTSYGAKGIASFSPNSITLGLTTTSDNKALLLTSDYLLRFNINGTVDQSFGQGGQFPISSELQFFTAMALQQDRKIILAGKEVIRLTAYGALDQNFGVNGKYISGKTFFNALCQEDGKIVLSGDTILRLLPNGVPDSSFVLNTSIINHPPFAAFNLSDGRMLIATGFNNIFPTNSSVVYRVSKTGAIDNSFGINGKLQFSNPHRIYITDQDKIVLAFQESDNANTVPSYKINRYTKDGSKETTFKVIPSLQYGEVEDILSLEDDKLLILYNLYPIDSASYQALRLHDKNGNITLEKKLYNYSRLSKQRDAKILLGGILSDPSGIGKSDILRLNGSYVNSPNKLPLVSIAQPVNGSVFYLNSDIKITADAIDVDGSIDSVVFYSNNIKIGTATKGPFSIMYKKVAHGSYSVYAKAYDNSGGQSISDSINISVSDTPNQLPVVSITQPTDGSSFTGNSDITITAAATDVDGIVDSVVYYSNNIKIATATKSPFSAIYKKVAPGSYYLYAKAYDNSGGQSISDSINISVSGSTNKLPVVAITQPTDGSSYIVNSDILITAAANDEDGIVDSVVFYCNNFKIGTSTINSPFYTIFKPSGPGTFAIHAKAYDNNGGQSISDSISIFVEVISCPRITSQPVSVSTCIGQKVKFNISAEGVGLAYRWEEYRLAGSFRPIIEGAQFSGTNTPSLTINSVKQAQNKYKYRCIVYGQCESSITSAAKVLTVNYPIIISNPKGESACQNTKVYFSVLASGKGMIYQWQRKRSTGEFYDLNNEGGFQNVTTAKLTINGAKLFMNNNLFRCKLIVDCNPNFIVYTEPATLSVDPCLPDERVTILQPGSEDGKDAVVYKFPGNEDVNYGNSLANNATAWTIGGVEVILRSFLEFDLSSIPVNAVIVSSKLSLYRRSSDQQYGDNSFYIQRVTEPWTESGITWNNQPAVTTANQVLVPVSSSVNQNYENINVTSLVKDMIANGNHGFMLKLKTEEIYRKAVVASSDDNNSQHPKLEVRYNIPLSPSMKYGELSTEESDVDIDGLMVAPNPSSNQTSVHFSQPVKEECHWTVYNSNGKLMSSGIINSNDSKFDLNTSLYPSGMYLVNMKKNGKTLSSKFVVSQ